jgi:predicted transcriptional regulator
MPSVNVYLSEDEYVKLANLAIKNSVKASVLARFAVKEFLERESQIEQNKQERKKV